MARPRSPHPYADPIAFDRLLHLIALLADEPGSGSIEDGGLEALAAALRRRAPSWPAHYPSIPTLRKDLVTLRRFGLLGPQVYRWGYYLGQGALTATERRLALDGLRILAQDLADSVAIDPWRALQRRLGTADAETGGQLLYPVRRSLSRPVVELNPQERMAQSLGWDSLVQEWARIEQAIRQGEAIALTVVRSPLADQPGQRERLYPLQLIFHEVGWYLLYESFEQPHFAVRRLERFGETVEILPEPRRSIAEQRQKLAEASRLIDRGWGIYLDNPEPQAAERQGRLKPLAVRVRFFDSPAQFILEGNKRHRHHKILAHPDNHGPPGSVDYCIDLPDRSRDAFFRWLNRHLPHVQVLAPPAWVTYHRQMIQAQLDRYHSPS